uniref:Uncharacterized protein n=1 Tax=Strigamia maritima TaxID=126957 RepID=T1JKB6_STRMM
MKTSADEDGEGSVWQELLGPEPARRTATVVQIETNNGAVAPNGRRKHLPITATATYTDGPTPIFRHKLTRLSSRRMRKRVVFKNGDCNVVQQNVAKRRRRYLADIFTTMVDIQWRWNLLVFSMGFILSWMCFAIVWWLICFTHGDLEPERAGDKNWKPCVYHIYSFASAFLFSVETQHTIGYGFRYVTEECPEAIFIVCLQSIAGVMIQAFMVGVVFAKLSRPKKRTQTLLYSRNAVICQRDGKLCLIFRVGDMRKSHIVEAHVRAQLIRKRITKEGEVLPYNHYDVNVGLDTGEDRLFFIWPTTIVHEIDAHSPFYNMSAHDLLREKFELVVILEGCIESTGMTTQARSSYLPNEILWGHRFEQLVTFKKETGEYLVDYSLFNNTYEVDTPLLSARQLDELAEYRATKHKTGGETARLVKVAEPKCESNL